VPRPSNECDTADRWIGGKSEQELLSDLKTYLGRLRDDPRNLQDRLRAAAIQARLGRTDEAFVHYEGVIRGYAAQNEIPSAIALCERLLGSFPEKTQLKEVLAALYARAPREQAKAATPVQQKRQQRPSDALEDAPTRFVQRQGGPNPQVVQRGALRPDANDDMRPTMPFNAVRRPSSNGAEAPRHRSSSREQTPILLTRRKKPSSGEQRTAQQPVESRKRPKKSTDEQVLLLTKPKRKR
jgi:hypothetical protein